VKNWLHVVGQRMQRVFLAVERLQRAADRSTLDLGTFATAAMLVRKTTKTRSAARRFPIGSLHDRERRQGPGARVRARDSR
jgi:hypothetical protein